MQFKDGKLKFILYMILWGLLTAIAGSAFYYGLLCVWGEAPPIGDYPAVISDPEAQVYDGDTIKDVHILVHEHAFSEAEQGIVWPGVKIEAEGVVIVTDIRIAGIDTPEKRTSTKNADGTPRSDASRDREKLAAQEARRALINLIESNENRVIVYNAIHGKYAGRTVADLTVGELDVSMWLIDNGHAKPYDGGTKPEWNWGK